jgi:hypothetical protein
VLRAARISRRVRRPKDRRYPLVPQGEDGRTAWDPSLTKLLVILIQRDQARLVVDFGIGSSRYGGKVWRKLLGDLHAPGAQGPKCCIPQFRLPKTSGDMRCK